ncbi:hypothetical protein QOT17_017915 [Balamuthia mandrillaris]
MDLEKHINTVSTVGDLFEMLHHSTVVSALQVMTWSLQILKPLMSNSNKEHNHQRYLHRLAALYERVKHLASHPASLAEEFGLQLGDLPTFLHTVPTGLALNLCSQEQVQQSSTAATDKVFLFLFAQEWAKAAQFMLEKHNGAFLPTKEGNSTRPSSVLYIKSTNCSGECLFSLVNRLWNDNSAVRWPIISAIAKLQTRLKTRKKAAEEIEDVEAYLRRTGYLSPEEKCTVAKMQSYLRKQKPGAAQQGHCILIGQSRAQVITNLRLFIQWQASAPSTRSTPSSSGPHKGGLVFLLSEAPRQPAAFFLRATSGRRSFPVVGGATSARHLSFICEFLMAGRGTDEFMSNPVRARHSERNKKRAAMQAGTTMASDMVVEEVEVTPMTQHINVELLVEQFCNGTRRGKPVFVCEQLKEHVERIVKRADRATREGFTTNRGNHDLILGIKGTGKSFFLQRLADCFNREPSKQIVALYIDLAEELRGSREPLQTIAEMLGSVLGQAVSLSDICALWDFLHRKKLCLVLLLDEYHTVYALETPVTNAWQLLMYRIGNGSWTGAIGAPISDRQRVMAVLTGSSPYLRSLAFGKLPVEETQSRFPGYKGLVSNLNSQRYIPFELSSIMIPYEWSLLLEAWGVTTDLALTDRQVKERQLFHLTGGNFGQLSAILENRSSRDHWATVQKHVTGPHAQLLRAMEMALNGNLEAGRSRQDDNPWDNMQWLPLSNLNSDTPFSLRQLYQASDDGAIQYDAFGEKVAFVSPLLASYLHEQRLRGLPEWLSPRLRLCLRLPFSKLGDQAEAALRHSLAMKHNLEAPEERGTQFHVHKHTGKCSLFENKQLKDVSLALPFVLKESPDQRGTDVVFFVTQEETKTWTMMRCQLKLGESSMSETKAEGFFKALTTKFGENEAALLEADLQSQSGLDFKLRVCYVLATTRPLPKQGDDLKNFVQQYNTSAEETRFSMQLWDHTYLIQNIWPEGLQRWAASAKLASYTNLPVEKEKEKERD